MLTNHIYLDFLHTSYFTDNFVSLTIKWIIFFLYLLVVVEMSSQLSDSQTIWSSWNHFQTTNIDINIKYNRKYNQINYIIYYYYYKLYIFFEGLVKSFQNSFNLTGILQKEKIEKIKQHKQEWSWRNTDI